MTQHLDPSLTVAIVMGAVIFVSAFVRGYSGFGYPIMVIAAGGLFTNPLPLVPVAIIGDLILCFQHGRAARPDVHWPTVGRLVAGALLGLLPGIWVLRSIDAETARILISALVLLASLMMLTGWILPRGAGPAATLGMGTVSGLVVPAGVAGPPAVMLVAAMGFPPLVFRATLLAYFVVLDSMSIGQFWLAGRIDAEVLWTALATAPLVVVGSALGARQVMRSDPAVFRRVAVFALMLMAAIGLLRALS